MSETSTAATPRQGPPGLYGETGCTYAISGDIEGQLCNRPAAHHVMWDAREEDSSSACEEHYQVARSLFPIYDDHPWSAMCNMPNTTWVFSWDHEPGCCAMLVDGETLAAVKAAELEPTQ
jgi:hypothetical protein